MIECSRQPRCRDELPKYSHFFTKAHFYRYQMNLIANCICLDVVIVGLESTPAAFKDPDAAKTCLAPGAGGLKFA